MNHTSERGLLERILLHLLAEDRKLDNLAHQIHKLQHHKELTIMAKGTFSVTFIVNPGAVPLSVATPETLGDAGGPLLIPAVEISGGTPPYTVSNVQGTMPDGVTINPDGTFAGVPTAAGSFDVTFDVADSLG